MADCQDATDVPAEEALSTELSCSNAEVRSSSLASISALTASDSRSASLLQVSVLAAGDVRQASGSPESTPPLRPAAETGVHPQQAYVAGPTGTSVNRSVPHGSAACSISVSPNPAEHPCRLANSFNQPATDFEVITSNDPQRCNQSLQSNSEIDHQGSHCDFLRDGDILGATSSEYQYELGSTMSAASAATTSLAASSQARPDLKASKKRGKLASLFSRKETLPVQPKSANVAADNGKSGSRAMKKPTSSSFSSSIFASFGNQLSSLKRDKNVLGRFILELDPALTGDHSLEGHTEVQSDVTSSTQRSQAYNRFKQDDHGDADSEADNVAPAPLGTITKAMTLKRSPPVSPSQSGSPSILGDSLRCSLMASPPIVESVHSGPTFSSSLNHIGDKFQVVEGDASPGAHNLNGSAYTEPASGGIAGTVVNMAVANMVTVRGANKIVGGRHPSSPSMENVENDLLLSRNISSSSLQSIPMRPSALCEHRSSSSSHRNNDVTNESRDGSHAQYYAPIRTKPASDAPSFKVAPNSGYSKVVVHSKVASGLGPALRPGDIVDVAEIKDSWLRLSKGGWVPMVLDFGMFKPYEPPPAVSQTDLSHPHEGAGRDRPAPCSHVPENTSSSSSVHCHESSTPPPPFRTPSPRDSCRASFSSSVGVSAEGRSSPAVDTANQLPTQGLHSANSGGILGPSRADVVESSPALDTRATEIVGGLSFREKCRDLHLYYCPEKLDSLDDIISRREHDEEALQKLWDLMVTKLGPWPPPGYREILDFLRQPDILEAITDLNACGPTRRGGTPPPCHTVHIHTVSRQSRTPPPPPPYNAQVANTMQYNVASPSSKIHPQEKTEKETRFAAFRKNLSLTRLPSGLSDTARDTNIITESSDTPTLVKIAANTLHKLGYNATHLSCRGASSDELAHVDLPVGLKRYFAAIHADSQTPPSPSVSSTVSWDFGRSARNVLVNTPPITAANRHGVCLDDDLYLVHVDEESPLKNSLASFIGAKIVSLNDCGVRSKEQFASMMMDLAGSKLCFVLETYCDRDRNWGHPDTRSTAESVMSISPAVTPTSRGSNVTFAMRTPGSSALPPTSTVTRRKRMFNVGDRVLFNTIEDGWQEGGEIDSITPAGYNVRIVNSGTVLADWQEQNIRVAQVSWTRPDALRLEELKLKQKRGECSVVEEEQIKELSERYEQFIEQGLQSMKAASPRPERRRDVRHTNSKFTMKRTGESAQNATRKPGVLKKLGTRIKNRAPRPSNFSNVGLMSWMTDTPAEASINTSNPQQRAAARIALKTKPRNLTVDPASKKPVQSFSFLGSYYWWVVPDEEVVDQPEDQTSCPLTAPFVRAARAERRRRHKKERDPCIPSPNSNCPLSKTSSRTSVWSEDSSSSDEATPHTYLLNRRELIQKIDLSLRREIVAKRKMILTESDHIDEVDLGHNFPHLAVLYHASKDLLVSETATLDDYHDKHGLTMSLMVPHTRSLLKAACVLVPSEPEDFCTYRHKTRTNPSFAHLTALYTSLRNSKGKYVYLQLLFNSRPHHDTVSPQRCPQTRLHNQKGYHDADSESGLSPSFATHSAESVPDQSPSLTTNRTINPRKAPQKSKGTRRPTIQTCT